MLLQPIEAPQVHIELLPDTAVAVDLEVDKDKGCTIHMWASAPPLPTADGEDSDSFREDYCSSCEYFCEEIEVDVSGIETYDRHDNDVILTGTALASSPCPCYVNGIDEVSFPCPEGHDGPSAEVSTDEFLNGKWLRYSYSIAADWRDEVVVPTRVVIQGYGIDDDDHLILSENLYDAINTYSNSGVCWGDNDVPSSLLGLYQQYVSAPANEDLCSFQSHEHSSMLASIAECNVTVPNAFVVRPGSPSAIICATTQSDVSAYLLLAISGASIQENAAYVGVYLHRNVAIDADTVINVWATDVLPIGKRLLFAETNGNSSSRNDFNNAICLGQVDSTFNLEPCESIQQQLSEPVELVNS